MSIVTADIPRQLLVPVRESLVAHREELIADPDRPVAADAVPAVDALLAQVDEGLAAVGATWALTGPRALVWRALYDVVCLLAEQVRDGWDDYWLGTVAPAELRGDLRALDACAEALFALGPSPDAP